VAGNITSFREGNLESEKVSESTDIAILPVPGKRREPGFFRFLCRLLTRRYYLLMRHLGSTIILLNHFLVPRLALVPFENSVHYPSSDYAALKCVL
jgi:hypothetical protein